MKMYWGQQAEAALRTKLCTHTHTHAQWNIFIRTLYLLSGGDLIFHDCTVKLTIVSTWGPNYLTAPQLHNVHLDLWNPNSQILKWDPDPLRSTHYLLVLAECWVRVSISLKHTSNQYNQTLVEVSSCFRKNDCGHKVFGWNSWTGIIQDRSLVSKHVELTDTVVLCC